VPDVGQLRASVHPARRGLTLEYVIAAVVISYISLGAVLYLRLGNPSYLAHLLEPRLWSSLLYLAPSGAAVLLVYYRLAVRTSDGGRVRGIVAGWRAAWRDARTGAFGPRRLAFALTTMLSAPLFFNAFTAWKSMIPVVHPYSMDLLLAHLDALLHGGAPHRLLEWLPLVPVDRIYFFAWGEVLLLALMVMAWRAETRVLLAFVLTWIVLGTVVAIVVPSAGPPYFATLTGRNDYAGLLTHLEHAGGAPLIAPQIQRNLWRIYESGGVATASGISAFPSMHVAVPALLTFASWGRSRVLSLMLGGFTIVIFISSVALGWHYAVDGYAGVLGAGAIWMLVARLRVPAAFGDRRASVPGETLSA
jgi:hypothetical protein